MTEVGDCFNQPLWSVSWPPSLQELTFGADFNQTGVNFSWPPSLKQLTFGHGFNQHITAPHDRRPSRSSLSANFSAGLLMELYGQRPLNSSHSAVSISRLSWCHGRSHCGSLTCGIPSVSWLLERRGHRGSSSSSLMVPSISQSQEWCGRPRCKKCRLDAFNTANIASTRHRQICMAGVSSRPRHVGTKPLD